MAHARPVVASGVGGLRDLVVDGETGLVVPARDPAALGVALEPCWQTASSPPPSGRSGTQEGSGTLLLADRDGGDPQRLRRGSRENEPVKRALITGIGGQDGSYLAELLLDAGY